jgi:pimeloyl-ACP methyl ester carboxylesterase
MYRIEAYRVKKSFKRLLVSALTTLAVGHYGAAAACEVSYKFVEVNKIKIFYREAGDPGKPTLLLLHGFPTSSFMFRDFIPQLHGRFHVIAPDYPGFGNSEAPAPEVFKASFDSLADETYAFIRALKIKTAIIYMQDFGGPVGMRIASAHPELIDGLIIQNIALTLDGWEPSRLSAVQALVGKETPQARAAAERRVAIETDLMLHQHGARDADSLNPDAWTNDAFALQKPENRRIMTDLQLDIPANLALYAKWQAYLTHQHPKTLVVWGDADPIFTPQGADSIKHFVPQAVIKHYNTGHFALEENGQDIAQEVIRQFGR